MINIKLSFQEMEITITTGNIDNYTVEDKNVTIIHWTARELRKNILELFPNIKKLYCDCNQLTTLEPIRNLINLQNLDCSGNQITRLEPINNLTNLQKLDC